MSKRQDFELLCDIKEAVQRISTYIGELSYDEFIKDKKTQDAVVRSLEIIGEAAKNLSVELKKKHRDIPWKELAGLRDRLIHQYFGVNFEIVWTIVRQELAGLAREIEKIPVENNKNKKSKTLIRGEIR